MRIALLHLAPIPANLPHNRRLVEKALTTAAHAGAEWILTPELVVCGYTFADQIGTDWILPQPDSWVAHLCQIAAQLHVTVFLSHPERDRQTGKLHNTLFVIAVDGTIAGRQRKIMTLKAGSEAWSSPGEQAIPVPVPPFGGVGLLICADAYPLAISNGLKAQGAQILVSAAAWAPGFHGPSGEWEQCALETGLPLFVCNRTGPDKLLDFSGAESVVVKNGQRLVAFTSPESAVLLVDWDLETQTVICQTSLKIEM